MLFVLRMTLLTVLSCAVYVEDDPIDCAVLCFKCWLRFLLIVLTCVIVVEDDPFDCVDLHCGC